MADMDGLKESKKYYLDIPQKTEGFFLKGSNSLDWGLKNRLARIFNPESGRTVMLAIDHGYFQGPTTGLERIDLKILPLAPYADSLMLTRGILRSIVPPSTGKSIVLRVTGGTSILKELSKEIGITTSTAANGDMSVYTDGGVTLFQGGRARSVTFSSTTTYTAATSGNAVYVDGVPITGSSAPMLSTAGRIVGLATLRDNSYQPP